MFIPLSNVRLSPSISSLGPPTPGDTLTGPLGLRVGADNQAMVANDCGRVTGAILCFYYGFCLCVVVVAEIITLYQVQTGRI